MANPLIDLERFGQSIWLDFITRRILDDGSLAKLVSDDGVTGVTSNPSIFQKAIAGSSDYDSAIEALLRKDLAVPAVFEALAVADIQRACDLFLAVYEKTGFADGFVSLEVDPRLAKDSAATIAEARALYKKVGRPNVMIKIPATVEGLPAIAAALADGINVNVTLIFSLERYRQVLDAWQDGMERAAKAGRDLKKIASVASFFVSRVDSAVDGSLEKSGHVALAGKAAIANAQAAYELFHKVKTTPRVQALLAKGARAQRPLWASTSTKNPKYRDTVYLEELIGPETVNTVPPQTVDAFRDHGKPRLSLAPTAPEAAKTLKALEAAGIDMAKVTAQLEAEGVKAFVESFDSLLGSIEKKRQSLKVA